MNFSEKEQRLIWYGILLTTIFGTFLMLGLLFYVNQNIELLNSDPLQIVREQGYQCFKFENVPG